MKQTKMPIILEPPSVIRLYVQLAVETLFLGIFALLAILLVSLLHDRFMNFYQKWILYLE